MVGMVSLRGKVVLKLRGPQTGGLTAAERADLITGRLNRLADGPEANTPDAVQAAALPDGTAALTLAGAQVVSVTVPDAKAAGFTQPIQLAQGWAKNLRAALSRRLPLCPFLRYKFRQKRLPLPKRQLSQSLQILRVQRLQIFGDEQAVFADQHIIEIDIRRRRIPGAG